MKASFVLTSIAVCDRACDAIMSVPLVVVHEVIIRPYSKDRSALQNSLMWMWLTLIAGELGETKDAIHERMKRKHLVRIYERDDPGYGLMISSVKAVRKSGMLAEAESMAAQITRITSTTTATVGQFTEYLEDIEKDAMGMGIILPHPIDRYHEAMGR